MSDGSVRSQLIWIYSVFKNDKSQLNFNKTILQTDEGFLTDFVLNKKANIVTLDNCSSCSCLILVCQVNVVGCTINYSRLNYKPRNTSVVWFLEMNW